MHDLHTDGDITNYILAYTGDQVDLLSIISVCSFLHVDFKSLMKFGILVSNPNWHILKSLPLTSAQNLVLKTTRKLIQELLHKGPLNMKPKQCK